MTQAQLPGKGFACYFAVPRDHIRPGKNTLAIRISSPASPLVIASRSLWAGPLDLNGAWLAKVERSFLELSPEEIASRPRQTFAPPEGLPGTLFNAMIHPLVPYALSGVLWSDKVPQPVAVRYAWADNPICNLYNGAGLPASPFRTDTFPLTTTNSHY